MKLYTASLHAATISAERGGGKTVYLSAIVSAADTETDFGGSRDTSVLEVMGLERGGFSIGVGCNLGQGPGCTRPYTIRLCNGLAHFLTSRSPVWGRGLDFVSGLGWIASFRPRSGMDRLISPTVWGRGLDFVYLILMLYEWLPCGTRYLGRIARDHVSVPPNPIRHASTVRIVSGRVGILWECIA